jgi:hypothetical protein
MDEIKKSKQSLLYIGPEGAVSGNFIIGDETLWASQKTMSEIFDTNTQAITKHLKNIYRTEELVEKSTCSKMEQIQIENGREVKRKIKFYNLDAIIAVGYRVNSKKATQFRIWATNILKEYMVKGFAIDVELLKNGSRFGTDYFKNLLDIIKDIRLSERRFYEQITDIYATSYDYNKDAEITREFFRNVQNKLHFAVSGSTAPEIISDRANSEKPNMGLKTWEGSPEGKIYLKDTKIAKNYLNEDEITELKSIVSMYLDYAEHQAIRHNPMSMKDWAERLDKFLEFNEYHILKGKGKISRKDVDKFVEKEYEKYRPIQDKIYKSDYDKFVEETKNLEIKKKQS